MSGRERRVSPRKDCAVPLRFRIISNAATASPVELASGRGAGVVASRGILEGEAVNLSERGIYFRSWERVSIGAPLEIYFRLPRELTGRSAEEVRCSARVVHVEQPDGNGGLTGVGATVERFEPISMIRNWHN
ncbi:MAG TPA: PilZ domain-containing protein [Candidatus Acidoferrales bacterium]|nr:PilZ domain-containing protein [Candidatus Acidoferrales bacterium]